MECPSSLQATASAPPVLTSRTSETSGAAAESSYGFKRKIGTFTSTVLILTSIFIVGTMSLLLFLWIGTTGNETWHRLVADDYLHTASNALSQLLAWCLTTQLATMIAMLVAFMMERSCFTLGKAAQMSLLRSNAQSSAALWLFWWKIRGKLPAFSPLSLPSTLIFVLASTFFFSFSIPIILMSDIGLASVPGMPNTFKHALNFDYSSPQRPLPELAQILSPRIIWTSKTSFFPTFAEYTEPPYLAPGVSDTGANLKVFLPLKAQTDRETIHSYTGKAMVVDSRVTMQIPYLRSVKATLLGSNILVRGFVSASQKTPRLYTTTNFENNRINQGPQNQSDLLPFSCVVALDGAITNDVAPWRISLCQLSGEESPWRTLGGLISEFQTDSHDSDRVSQEKIGPVYLVPHVTKGNLTMWETGLQSYSDGKRWFFPENYQDRDEWKDMSWANGNLVLSFSLAYVSFMTATIPVSITSQQNRTEPEAIFNHTRGVYDYGAIRTMLGQYPHMPKSQRGILELIRKGSWMTDEENLPPAGFGPFTRSFADAPGNWTVCLWPCRSMDGSSVVADEILISLFQEILSSGGSVAFAIQAVLVTLTQSLYYDAIDLFDIIEPANVTIFDVTNIVKRKTGLYVVLTAIAIHLLTLSLVLILFRRTKYSRVGGDAWHVAAQLDSCTTRDLLASASLNDDDTVEDKLIGKSRKNHVVTIVYNSSLKRAELVDLETQDVEATQELDAAQELDATHKLDASPEHEMQVTSAFLPTLMRSSFASQSPDHRPEEATLDQVHS